MNTEEQLDRLRDEIIDHRKKAESLRKRAGAQDAIADAKVKECAALGTSDLPLLAPDKDAPGYHFQIRIKGKSNAAPSMPVIKPLSARERMRKAIADCDERAYEKAQADLEKETKHTGMSDDPRASFTEDGTCRID